MPFDFSATQHGLKQLGCVRAPIQREAGHDQDAEMKGNGGFECSVSLTLGLSQGVRPTSLAAGLVAVNFAPSVILKQES